MNNPYIDALKEQAQLLAKRFKHRFITLEHLLWIMLESNDADVIKAVAYSGYSEFDRDVMLYQLKKILSKLETKSNNHETSETLGFQRVLENSQQQQKEDKTQETNGANVLLAMFYEQESPGTKLLKSQHVTRKDIEDYLARPRFQPSPASEKVQKAMKSLNIETLLNPQEQQQQQATNLGEFLEDLNEKYRRGKLSQVIGRDKEIAATVRVLSQSRKSNPLLVGEPGVGKTTIAEGLAQLIEEQKVPQVLRNATIYALRMSALIAGTQYRGEFEKRINKVVTFLKSDPHAILFIDEIHMIIGAGSSNGSNMDVANILKPALASGEISCIGATTYKEFRQIFEKDEALKRRFQEVDVPEPSVEQTIEILKGLKPRLEKYHHLTIDETALEMAVRLGKKYIKDRKMPDIALDVLDEACASINMHEEHLGGKVVTITDVQTVVAAKAGLPIEQLVKTDNNKHLEQLSDHLKGKIFGQEHAVDTLVSAITMAHAGLREVEKPIGSFLLAGPTGVGKTEICKQLAIELNMKLLRLDMSEYTDSHSSTKLIGTAPGYVGYDQGGQLTEAVNKEPHSIVLFDEIEKAHPQIYNLLLQVLDYGVLTDGQSRKVDFRHTIIVMTTNAGAQVLQQRNIGFGQQDNTTDSAIELGRVFSPEFRNRFDEIVQFNSLPKSVAGNIADKLVGELQKTLSDKNVTIELSEPARAWLVDKGYSRELGARPMARVVTNQLKKPLAKELLYGHLKKGGRVLVDVNDDKLNFTFT
jgi:ATP-dependent Clp protease ATP-binding subunit ClpA